MLSKLYKHMCKHYHAYSIAANTMLAVAMAGLALLGVLNTMLTATMLVGLGGILAAIYFLGKWLDQEVEDLDKVSKHDHKEGHSCGVDKKQHKSSNK